MIPSTSLPRRKFCIFNYHIHTKLLGISGTAWVCLSDAYFNLMQERQKAVQIWQNNSRRRNSLLVYQEKGAPFVLFTNLFPRSPLLLQFRTNPPMRTEDLGMLEAEAFYLFTDHCSFCATQLAVP